MQIDYVDITPEWSEDLILTYYENGKRKKKNIHYAWYFYISSFDYKIHEDDLRFVKCVPENKDWVKVYCSLQTKHIILKKFVELKINTYEADLPLPIRFWIDSGYHIAEPSKFRLLYIDIEVDDSVSGLRIGQDTILSFAAVDSDGKTYQLINEDYQNPDKEKELLMKIMKLVEQYDILIGWNSKGYDLPYIKDRCKKYQLWFPYACHIDMMQRMIHAYRFDTQIKSFSLDSIAQQFLGKSKPRTDKIIKMFLTDRDAFLKYNLNDVLLLKELNDKFKVITMALTQAYWCNVTPRMMGQGGHGMYNLLDSLLLVAAHKRGLKGQTPKYSFDQLDKMTEEELEAIEYPGGLVLDPKPGYYKNVYIFDFKTMYPSIILSSNIGPDTLDPSGDIINPSGHRFRSEPKSIFCEVLGELLTKRKEYKTRKLELIEQGLKNTPEYESVEANEAVVKELGNSVYGITGAKWGRYFNDGEIASSITLLGQFLLKTLQTFLETKGYKVITGDTDSCMVVGSEDFDVNAALAEYHKYVAERLSKECNIKNSRIELAFDRYFKTFILVAKKNYVGWLVNQEGKKIDYVHVRGLEVIKSDTCKLASRTVKELIDLLLKTENTSQFYLDWLLEKKKTIFDNLTPDDLKIHKKIKNLEQYKNPSLAVIIAQRKLAKGEILVHKEIDYIITGKKEETLPVVDKEGKPVLDKLERPKMKKLVRLDGVEVKDFSGHFDMEHYWDKLILPICTRLLNVAFPEIEWDQYTYNIQAKQMKLI